MRAVRCVAGAPTVVETAGPAGEGVRVRVGSAGICGSDLHLLAWSLPVVMGHEMAGVLDDGTPVAVVPIAPCGECDPCRSGEPQRCVTGPAMVMGVGRDGGMADEVVVPATAISRLAAGVAVRDACLVEPLAVAVHGVRRGRIRPTERVAVIGGGSIGLAAAAAAQAIGASVDVAARHDRQRAAADRLGAGAVDGDYDVVVEAAGTASALADAIDRCRPGGRIVMLGSYWDGDVALPGQTLCMKEIDLIPASMYGQVGPSRDFDVAAAILAHRPELSDAMITHRFPLDAVAEAFAVAADRAAGAIKVVLEP
jgi:threonine dehydrogenase-like Zn-dependent dehydrogenase